MQHLLSLLISSCKVKAKHWVIKNDPIKHIICKYFNTITPQYLCGSVPGVPERYQNLWMPHVLYTQPRGNTEAASELESVKRN